MGELKVYQPTKGMSAADRTAEGYRAIIKEWIHSLEDVLSSFYTIRDFTNGNGVSLSPVDPNINLISQQIWVTDTEQLKMWSSTSSDGNSGDSISAYCSTDPKLYVWIADDGAGFGMSDCPVFTGVMNTVNFDGNEQYVSWVHAPSASAFRISKSNGVESTNIDTNPKTNRNSVNYCIKPHTCDSHCLINNHLYYMDGGLGLPNAKSIFTVNDEKYFFIYNATCFKF